MSTSNESQAMDDEDEGGGGIGLNNVSDVMSPTRVKVGHTSGVPHGTLLTTLHDTMICLIGIAHRGRPESIESIIRTVNQEAHIENVVVTISVM